MFQSIKYDRAPLGKTYELEKDEQRFTAVVLVEVCVCYSIIYMYVVDEYKHNTSSQEVIITADMTKVSVNRVYRKL